MKVEAMSFSGIQPVREQPAEAVERLRKESSAPTGASEPRQVQPEELLDKIKELTQDGTYSVRFEMNDQADRMVIRLVDLESGEEIRQIPAEELLKLAKQLKQLRGNLVDAIS